MEEETKVVKKGKKGLIIAIVIIIILLIIGAIGGFLWYKYVKENESVGTTWGDIYYAYLKEASEKGDLSEAELYGIQLDMEDPKLQFCEVEKDENPFMIMTYSRNNNEYVNVYNIEDDNKVTYVAYKEPADLVLLYNIKLEKYIWYLHTESENEDAYIPLESIKNEEVQNMQNTISNNVIENSTTEIKTTDIEAEYTIKKDEETKVETSDGEELSISEFDKIFVKPEVDYSSKIDFNVNLNAEEIRNVITEMIAGYKTEEQIITDEVKSDISNKVQEIKEKVDEINKAKEELEKEEKIKITQKNVQEKIGEHLKWFKGAYLGVIYGWPSVFEYKDVTDKITIPGNEDAMIYELVGLKSIDSLKSQLSKYVDKNKFSKFDKYDFVSELTEYKGKVYWCNLGVGDGPSIDTKDAKILSSKNGTTKVQLENINVLGNFLTEVITLTVKYNEDTDSYLITDWSVKEMY